uniref:Uncharacterized protein n=1 Tax=Arundo donax TaxID=35708 RepID=A0A0A9HMY8_ARUDO
MNRSRSHHRLEELRAPRPRRDSCEGPTCCSRCRGPPPRRRPGRARRTSRRRDRGRGRRSSREAVRRRRQGR